MVDLRAQGSASTGAAIRVHYKGFNGNYDEWIDIVKEGSRVKEIGLFSGAEGVAKYSARMQQEAREKEEELKRSLKQYQPPKQMSGSESWGIKFFPKESSSS